MSVLFSVLFLSQFGVLCVSLYVFANLPGPNSLRLDSASMVSLDQESKNSPSVMEHFVVEGDESHDSESSRLLTYRVHRGDTLARIWTTHGAPSSGALKASQAFRDVGIAAPSLRVGEELSVTVNLVGDITHLEKKLEDGRAVVIGGNSIDGYEGRVLEADVATLEREVSGVILSSFAESAADAGVPYSVVDDFVDLFSNRLEFRRDLQPGDTFTISYTERRCRRSGTELPAGEIISASIVNSSNLLAAVGYRNSKGSWQYFDEQGKPLGNYFLRYPLKFSRISSTFSEARFHPVLHVMRPHNGIDFAAPVGTPVRSIADGVVVDSGYRGGAGNMVKIQHNDRYSSAYLHLSKVASGLRPGMRVSRGQVIGTVGMTGLATGPHLHFSFFDRDVYVDPLSAKLPSLLEGIDPIPNDLLLVSLRNIRRRHETLVMAAAESERRHL